MKTKGPSITRTSTERAQSPARFGPWAWLIGRPGQQVQALIGLLVILAALPLAITYARYPVRQRDRAVPAFVLFAKRWASDGADWVRYSESKITERLDAKDMGLYDSLVLRSAYSRWRVRDRYPELFDAIVARWEVGPWSVATREAWVKAFTDHDNRWLTRRGLALGTGQSTTPAVAISTVRMDSDMFVVLNGGPRTADLGSFVSITADYPASQIPAVAPRVFWSLNRPELRGHCRRLGLMTRIPGAPPGFQRVRVDVDMSYEPFWLNPGNVVIRFALMDFPEQARVLTVDFSDSPLLPVAAEGAAPG